MEKIRIIDRYIQNGSPLFQKLFSNLEHLRFGDSSDDSVDSTWISPVKENKKIFEDASPSIFTNFGEDEIELNCIVSKKGNIVIEQAIVINEELPRPDTFTVYICIEEQLLHRRELTSNEIIITSSPSTPNYKNRMGKGIYSDYKLSLIYFYYLLGYYHNDYKNYKTDKLDLFGLYHRSNYKMDRDTSLKKFSEYATFKRHGKKYEDDIASIYDLKFAEGWYKNHTTHHLDYITTVCNLVFESSFNSSDYHPTEKLIKCLLYSKMNIFFMYLASPNLILNLYDDGFWFLNFEFINFDEFKKQKIHLQYETLHTSVIETIKYINDIHSKEKNLNIVHEKLVNLYKPKLERNYNLFFEILNSKDISENILNFIIKNYKNRKML